MQFPQQQSFLTGTIFATLVSEEGTPIHREVIIDGSETGRRTFEDIPVNPDTYSVSLAGDDDYYPSSHRVSVRTDEQSLVEFHIR